MKTQGLTVLMLVAFAAASLPFHIAVDIESAVEWAKLEIVKQCSAATACTQVEMRPYLDSRARCNPLPKTGVDAIFDLLFGEQTNQKDHDSQCPDFPDCSPSIFFGIETSALTDSDAYMLCKRIASISPDANHDYHLSVATESKEKASRRAMSGFGPTFCEALGDFERQHHFFSTLDDDTWCWKVK